MSNINEAFINAAAKINSKDDALNVAIEMLDQIGNGKAYDALEYVALTNRMKRVRAVDMIAAVRSHALRNYGSGGWDVVVECYEDEDILRAIGIASTNGEAIKRVSEIVAVSDSVRRDVESEIF